MLELKEIHKIYEIGKKGNKDYQFAEALKGISLNFRKNEFVSVLGPSGCGKTTLLNIIGGLDQYTSGDLIINGVSTKEYNDRDWDTYRNHRIGFVFQNYNLIPHQSILSNVELALSIGGMEAKERKERAKEALIQVGLKDHIYKKPGQLSGGQMQRVAIARALVNNPDIILADEPTGALDTMTGIQVMETLKNISKDKLIIMVTHNPDLANKYSTRIVKLLDGNLLEDSNPFEEEEQEKEAEKILFIEKKKEKKSAMSFLSSFKLSVSNLLTKKKRTFITALAGSIGIIGICTILAVSSGMGDYVKNIQSQTTGFNYISISANHRDMGSMMPGGSHNPGEEITLAPYPDNISGIYPYKPTQVVSSKKQNLSTDYIQFLETNLMDYVIGISYNRKVAMKVVAKTDEAYSVVSTSSSNWQELLNNEENVMANYTILKGKYPKSYNEVAIVVDEYNRLSTSVLNALGIHYDESLNLISYDVLMQKTFKLVANDDFYYLNDNLYKSSSTQTELQSAYNADLSKDLKISGIMRANKDAATEWVNAGIAYTTSLTDYILETNKNSKVANAQMENDKIDVTTGLIFDEDTSGGVFGSSGNTYEKKLVSLGASSTPSGIMIYPKDYESKSVIIDILDQWNAGKEEKEQVLYLDVSNAIISMMDSMINITTNVLVAFSAISLVVSSLMIAIIIYASVIERVKEIGVLRSMGARKKDISRVFESEALIIGFVSGLLAILVTLLLCVLINAILSSLTDVDTIASLKPGTAVIMILVNMGLTLIASLVPAKIAARKDPVNALRSE